MVISTWENNMFKYMRSRSHAAVAASKEAIHLKLLLGELGINHDKLIIEEDNAACIAQAKGGLRFIRKAKHYQIALRFIQKNCM